MKLTCQNCNKEFRVPPSRRNKAKFCSYSCKNKSQLGKQPANIEGLTLGRAWNKGLHVQSNNALQKWRESGGIVWNKSDWIPKTCPTCKKDFSVPPNRSKTAKYCSFPCYTKGDDVSYSGLHKWVQRHLGKPDTCVHCGRSGLTGNQIDWANKSHEYKRDLADWLRLCKPCHKRYDGYGEKTV